MSPAVTIQSQINNNILANRMMRITLRSSRAVKDIDRLISWHTTGGKRFFTRYAPELIRAHKWCFIVGCNNSGTSLLQHLLESMANISTFAHEGQRYTRALKRAEKRGHERVWFEYVDELRMTQNDSQTCVPRLLHDWMRELTVPIHETILEKTTANAVRMEWLQTVFPRSYFIGLVRNGYAVTEGIRRKGHKPVSRGARHWNNVNRTLIEDSKNIARFMLVRYEDLVENPAGMAGSLCDFLDLHTDNIPQIHNTVVSNQESRIVNMNAESFERLSRQDLAEIYTEASEMLDYFGYTPEYAK
jgi:hypothetical protein